MGGVNLKVEVVQWIHAINFFYFFVEKYIESGIIIAPKNIQEANAEKFAFAEL